MKKIITVVGARPQFVKAAVLSRKIREKYAHFFEELIVHTGQHYDANMSEVFFDQMKIPKPHRNLEIGSGSHGAMTGRMLEGIEGILKEECPDCLLTYGDTNSTIAGALAASKLHIPVVHVEAGLRSFNKNMPEEQNRILTDHISDFLFCPTDTAVANLKEEGISKGVYKTGDIMLDASLYYRQFTVNLPFSLPGEFFLITLHRAENTDDPVRLRNIVEALNESQINGVLPLHPRTKKVLEQQGLEFTSNIITVPPVSFFEMIALEEKCMGIITDSGGVQKEAYFFKKPCITLRDQTEWVETVDAGWNVLVGSEKNRILGAIKSLSDKHPYNELYGSGNAADEILSVLKGAI
ncbi:non-hydrolyzing UDP-N-acetylglucosamine 2-epimerase [Spirochaeta lutea]|uniref:UDP-N-acetylglucosamine 2-epimerase n=1 Tax=Spirochaeta lutea TaxID=1480694 RepID=A0A098QTR5_9SPIO|nr:UDP-N-acetylglucosamine 2-epimerase (non-hydrolyzing) [Spirochaeta lutea]KGE71134.1 UDP-N-acetylglucosamine 2-epimerase [Spirochaeta lutea]